jgi:Uma2 family endonuclease
MPVLIHPDHGTLSIPNAVDNLESFREWVHTDTSIPEKLPVHFLNGEVWVDYSMEEFTSHNQIKAALYAMFGRVVLEEDRGTYLPDGMRYTSLTAKFSTEPDAMVVTHETMAAGVIEFSAGKSAKATELLGVPDLVVEIVSPSSVDKDFDWLMDAYFEAGIAEYWLIDALDADSIRFEIFKRGPQGFRAVRKSAGWTRSTVIALSFRMTNTTNRSGWPVYRFETK